MILVNKRFKYLVKKAWLDKRGYVWVYTIGPSGRRFHRVIMELHLKRKLLRSELIDHKNGNKSDNRISNLRLCNQSQNMSNQVRKNKGLKKIYNGNYQVRIVVNKKYIHLGTFKTKTEARSAYNVASKRYHKEFGRAS